MIRIDEKQWQGKPKKVGTLDGKDLMAKVTKGGFHVIGCPKGGNFEYLAVGPHAAVARSIAEKRNPGIVWTALNKGDWVDPACYEHVLPKYEAITDELRRRHGDDK